MSSSDFVTQDLIQTITLAKAKDAIRKKIGRWIIIGEGFKFSQKTVDAWITTTASIEKYLLQRCKPHLTDAEFQELIIFVLDKVISQPIRLKKVEYFSFLPRGGITPAPGEHPEYRELKQMLEKQLAPNPWPKAETLSASFVLLAMITVTSIIPAVAAVASSNELSSNDESHDVALLNPSAVGTIGAIKQLALEDMYGELGVGDVLDVASYEERTTHHIFSVAESLVSFSQGWMVPESEARLIEFLLGNKNVISKLNLIFNNASNKPLLYKTIAKLSQALVVKVSGEGLYSLTFDFAPATDGRPLNSNYLIVLLGQVIMQMQKDDLSKISPDELLHMYLILHYFKRYRTNEKETVVSEQIDRIRAAIGPDFDRLMLKGRKASAERLGRKVEELFPEARLTVEAVANSTELSSNDENSDGTLTALNILDQELTRGIGGLALQNMDKIAKAKEKVSAFELRFREDAIFLANKLINFCNEAVTLKDKEYLMHLLLEDKNSAPILNIVLHSASNKPLLHRIIAKLSYELNADISGDGRQRVTLNMAPTTDGRPRNANYLISSLGEAILQIPESDLSKISPKELLRMYTTLHLFRLLHPNAENDVDEKRKQIHSVIGSKFDELFLEDRKKIEKELGVEFKDLYSERKTEIAKKAVAEENPSATDYGFVTLLQIFMAAAFIWLAIRMKNGAFTMQGCYYAAQRLIQNLKLAQFDFDKNNDCIVTNYQLLAFLGSSDRISLLKELLSTDKVSVDVRRLADDRFKIIIPYMNRHDRAAYNRHLESLAAKADFSNLEEKFPPLKKHLKRRIMPVLNRYLPTLSKFIVKLDIVKEQGVVLTFNILNKLHIPEDILNVFNRELVQPWSVIFPFDALDKNGCIKPGFEKTLKEFNEISSLKFETINRALSLELDVSQEQVSQCSTHISNAGKSLRAAVSVAPEPVSYNENTKPIEKTVGSSKTLGEISKDLEKLFKEFILSSDSGSLRLQEGESRKQIILELDGDKYYINRPIGERQFYLSNSALRNLIQTFFINIKVSEEGIRIQKSRKRKDLCKITLINPTGLILDNARFINQQQASLFKRLSQLANVYHPMEIKLDYSGEHYNVVFKLNEDNFFEIKPYGLSDSGFLRCVKQSLMAAKMAVNDIGEGNQFSVPLQDITEHKDELQNKEQFLALKKERFEADEKKELQEGKEEEKESEADKIVEENGSAGKGKHRKPKANIPHQKNTGHFFIKKIQNIGSSSSAFFPKFDEKKEATEIRRLVKVIDFRLLSLEAVKNEDNLLELYLALANLLERLTKCVKQFERVGVIVPIWFRNIHEPQSLMRLRAIVIKNLNYPNHYDFVRLVAGNFCKAIILSEAEEGFSIPYPINIDKITSDCLFKAELSVCFEKGEDFNELERNIDYDEIIALIEKLKSCYKRDADEKLLSKWVQCHILLVRALILRMSELFAIKNTQSPDETESKLGSALYNVLQNARAMRNDIAHPSGQQGAPAVLEEAAFIIELSKLEKPQSSSSGPSRSRRG